MRFPFPRRSAALLAAALAAVMVTPMMAYSALFTAHGDTGRDRRRGPAPATVTLITGDKVKVTQGSGGAPSVDVERAPGATGSVRIATESGDTYVYPDEAVAYIAAGRLDKQLFDVTQLITQGYDDAHSSELPLIVTHTKDSATLKPGRAARPRCRVPRPR